MAGGTKFNEPMQQLSRIDIHGEIALIKLARNFHLRPNISLSNLSSSNDNPSELKALVFENSRNGMFNFYNVRVQHSSDPEKICTFTKTPKKIPNSKILGGILYKNNTVIGLMINEREGNSNNDTIICFTNMAYYSGSILEKVTNESN